MAETFYRGFKIQESSPGEFEVTEPSSFQCPVDWIDPVEDLQLNGGQTYLGGNTLGEAKEIIDDLMNWLEGFSVVREYKGYQLAYSSYDLNHEWQPTVHDGLFVRGNTADVDGLVAYWIMDNLTIENFEDRVDEAIETLEDFEMNRDDLPSDDEYSDEEEEMWETEAERGD